MDFDRSVANEPVRTAPGEVGERVGVAAARKHVPDDPRFRRQLFEDRHKVFRAAGLLDEAPGVEQVDAVWLEEARVEARGRRGLEEHVVEHRGLLQHLRSQEVLADVHDLAREEVVVGGAICRQLGPRAVLRDESVAGAGFAFVVRVRGIGQPPDVRMACREVLAGLMRGDGEANREHPLEGDGRMLAIQLPEHCAPHPVVGALAAQRGADQTHDPPESLLRRASQRIHLDAVEPVAHLDDADAVEIEGIGGDFVAAPPGDDRDVVLLLQVCDDLLQADARGAVGRIVSAHRHHQSFAPVDFRVHWGEILAQKGGVDNVEARGFGARAELREGLAGALDPKLAQVSTSPTPSTSSSGARTEHRKALA